jgi:hypothetical protein
VAQPPSNAIVRSVPMTGRDIHLDMRDM